MPLRAVDRGRDSVEAAQDALERAEQAIEAAQRQRDEADEALDRALAERGWNRFYGGFTAVMYTNASGEGHVVPRADLLRALEAERRP